MRIVVLKKQDQASLEIWTNLALVYQFIVRGTALGVVIEEGVNENYLHSQLLGTVERRSFRSVIAPRNAVVNEKNVINFIAQVV